MFADGPMWVKILAPDSAAIGVTMYMNCFADSHPDCEYSWFFDNLNQPLPGDSILKFLVTNESDGTYICRARNPVTNIVMYEPKVFTGE